MTVRSMLVKSCSAASDIFALPLPMGTAMVAFVTGTRTRFLLQFAAYASRTGCPVRSLAGAGEVFWPDRGHRRKACVVRADSGQASQAQIDEYKARHTSAAVPPSARM